MTLEEHIWEEEKFVRRFAGIAYDTRLHDENGELMWKAEQYEKSQHEHEERKSLLEELKSLREEHEVYKKALELTAEDYSLGIRIRAKSANEYIEHYLDVSRKNQRK